MFQNFHFGFHKKREDHKEEKTTVLLMMNCGVLVWLFIY